MPHEGMWSGVERGPEDQGRVRSVANAEVSSSSADSPAALLSPSSRALRGTSRELPAASRLASSRGSSSALRTDERGAQRESSDVAAPKASAHRDSSLTFRSSSIASLARRVTASCEPNQHQQAQAFTSFSGRESAHHTALYQGHSVSDSHSHPPLHPPEEHPQHRHLSQGQEQLCGQQNQQDSVQQHDPQERHADNAQQHRAVELTIKDRAIAAGAAAVLSAVIMNPLDVAKTRLQAQAAGYSYTQGTPNAPCNNCGSPWPDPITRRHLASYQLEWLRGALDLGHPHFPEASPNVAPSPSLGTVPGNSSSASSNQLQAPGGIRGSAHFPSAATAASVGADGAACAVACDFPQPTVKAYRGPLDVFLRVIREEGAVRLWRGTSAGLLMAVPSVGIYMPVYDSLLARLAQPGAGQTEAPWTAPYAPLIAGALSRSLACILCAPLELARTRIQAASQNVSGAHANQAVSGRSILSTLQHAVRAEGGGQGHAGGVAGAVGRMRVLWRGVDAQLARDVPFSAICWSILEPTRKALLALDLASPRREEHHQSIKGASHEWAEGGGREAGLGRILAANFGAGVVAGSLAAAVTTPLDVAKTRVQIEMSASLGGRGVGYHLKEIWREGGWKALYTGVGPRSIKAGPSVGIIVSFYEIMKHLLGRRVDLRS